LNLKFLINNYKKMTEIKPLVNLVTNDKAKGEAKELFKQIEASTGKVPKWMRVMANCPDILVGFFTMFKATMDDTPVDKALKWKIAYQVSEINKCEFCVSVSKAQLKQFGLNDSDIENIGKPSDEKEKVAFEYTKAASSHAYNIDPKLFAKVKEHFTDEQIVELTSVVGLFNFINRFNDSLGVLPDVQ